jgi:hypothetical protein
VVLVENNDVGGSWVLYAEKPVKDMGDLQWCVFCTPFALAENQPVTDLPWTETLIRRSDYE